MKPPKIQTIIHEYQVTKKKYEWFTMKSNIGDFGQNSSTFALPWIKCEFKYHKQLSSINITFSLPPIASDGPIVNRAEQIKYHDKQG